MQMRNAGPGTPEAAHLGERERRRLLLVSRGPVAIPATIDCPPAERGPVIAWPSR